MNKDQLVRYLIDPVLQHIDMFSQEARELVYETGLIESNYEYIHQIRGPALGFWQMEPATFNDHWKWVRRDSDRFNRINSLRSGMHGDRVSASEMVGNMYFAVAMCRVHYRRKPGALPDTVTGRALYWKTYYNTHLGKGTVSKYVRRVNKG